MPIGSLRQTGVMICAVKETTNAKLDPALDKLAAQTAIAKSIGKLRQRDVPFSLAVTTSIHALMAWLARDT